MFGGTETIAMTIEWAMAELMKCPEELSKVQEELAQVVGLNRKVHENDLDNLPHLKCTIKDDTNMGRPPKLAYGPSPILQDFPEPNQAR